MLVYWLMFAAPALVALVGRREVPARKAVGWVLLWVSTVVIVGWRFEVGGDWFSYDAYVDRLRGASIAELLEDREPAFAWLVASIGDLGGTMISVNVVCALLFATGMMVFCRDQPHPWLAVVVAVPYLVIVVAMGYTRQSVAIGCIMAGWTFLVRRRVLLFVVCALLAALFHRTAVVVIPLAAIAEGRGRWWTLTWVAVAAAVSYDVLLASGVDDYRQNYLEAEYDSAGAAVRVGMNVLPAFLLLLFRHRVVWRTNAERNLWLLLALLSFVAVGALVASPSSTAVDRLALYLIPVQMFVFARLPDWLGGRAGYRQWVAVVVMYYALIQYTWLFHAVHASDWLPYRSYLLLD